MTTCSNCFGERQHWDPGDCIHELLLRNAECRHECEQLRRDVAVLRDTERTLTCERDEALERQTCAASAIYVARDTAFEEAAKVCDAYANELRTSSRWSAGAAFARDCARRIRTLKAVAQ